MTNETRAETGAISLDLGHRETEPDGDECANCGHMASDHDGDEGACTADGCDCAGMQAAYSAGGPVELRYAVAPLTDIEVRDEQGNGDGTWTMSGYAAVFNETTVLYDGKFERVTEDIDPAAFDACLRTQGLTTPTGVVHFNYGHDMLAVIAATNVTPGQPGWLDLRADGSGLFYLAKASKDDFDAKRLATKLRDKVVQQASFAFTIARAEWTDTETADGPDVSHRRILEVGHLYDVCACPQGAYAQTVSQLRTYGAAIGQYDGQLERQLEGQRVSPDSGGVIAVSPNVGGGVVSRRMSAEQLRGVRKHQIRK